MRARLTALVLICSAALALAPSGEASESRCAGADAQPDQISVSDYATARRQPCAAHVLVEDVATRALGVLAPLALEPGADLRLGARGLGKRQPVARRPAFLLRGEDLADVPRLQLVVQRHDLAVDLRAD